MLSNTLAELLKLPASERIEIAMALWDSLTDAEREAELALTPEQEAELDRRLAEHIANPDSAIPWEEVRRRCAGGSPAGRDAMPCLSATSRVGTDGERSMHWRRIQGRRARSTRRDSRCRLRSRQAHVRSDGDRSARRRATSAGRSSSGVSQPTARGGQLCALKEHAPALRRGRWARTPAGIPGAARVLSWFQCSEPPAAAPREWGRSRSDVQPSSRTCRARSRSRAPGGAGAVEGGARELDAERKSPDLAARAPCCAALRPVRGLLQLDVRGGRAAQRRGWRHCP